MCVDFSDNDECKYSLKMVNQEEFMSANSFGPETIEKSRYQYILMAIERVFENRDNEPKVVLWNDNIDCNSPSRLILVCCTICYNDV